MPILLYNRNSFVHIPLAPFPYAVFCPWHVSSDLMFNRGTYPLNDNSKDDNHLKSLSHEHFQTKPQWCQNSAFILESQNMQAVNQSNFSLCILGARRQYFFREDILNFLQCFIMQTYANRFPGSRFADCLTNNCLSFPRQSQNSVSQFGTNIVVMLWIAEHHTFTLGGGSCMQDIVHFKTASFIPDSPQNHTGNTVIHHKSAVLIIGSQTGSGSKLSKFGPSMHIALPNPFTQTSIIDHHCCIYQPTSRNIISRHKWLLKSKNIAGIVQYCHSGVPQSLVFHGNQDGNLKKRRFPKVSSSPTWMSKPNAYCKLSASLPD